jgi:anti-sigma B factor antagonist
VRVTGELDLATAPGLHERLQSLVREGSPSIDLDLDAVPFCDLAGLDALLRAHAAARRAGGRLVVRGSCPPLRLMVRLLRPDGVFELAPLDGEPPARRA